MFFGPHSPNVRIIPEKKKWIKMKRNKPNNACKKQRNLTENTN